MNESPSNGSERMRIAFSRTLGGALLALAVAGTVPLALGVLMTLSNPHDISFLELGLLAVVGGAVGLVGLTGWRALKVRTTAELEREKQLESSLSAPSDSSDDSPERDRGH